MEKSILRKAQTLIVEAINKESDHIKQEKIKDITFHCNGIIEPGYTNSKSGVFVLGNWNDIEDIYKQLEDLGCELEWSDEWAECSMCLKVFRTQPNNYGWEPSFAIVEGEMFCSKCIKKSAQEYLKTLEGQSKKALFSTLNIDPSNYGYHKMDGNFERGYHEGQNSDPKMITESLKNRGVYRFIFEVESVSQFDMRFSVFVHSSEVDKIKDWDCLNKDGVDLVDGLKTALSMASQQFSQTPRDGIKITRINAEAGTAQTTIVSTEDFIKGNI